MILLTALSETVARGGLLLRLAAGVAWTSAVNLVLGAVARLRTRTVAAPAADVPTVVWRQKFARWRHSLGHLAGWQYPARLRLCPVLASLLRWCWPDHHLHGIALTAGLLCERRIDAIPIKITQRALGAVPGVTATVLLVVMTLPTWIEVALIGALAGLRPLLRARNYLAYSAGMTPLIILILDAAAHPAGSFSSIG
jgi:hypothetical protein